MQKAVEAHTNLNTFSIIVSVLEGGAIYGSGTADATAAKIIKLCKDEQQRQLRIYDRKSVTSSPEQEEGIRI